MVHLDVYPSRRLVTGPAGLAAVRWLALAGCAALVMTLVNVIVLPAAVVGMLAGVAAARLVSRNLEQASLRLGVALLVSVVVTFASLAMADPYLGGAGALAGLSFFTSWRICEQARDNRRRAWGMRQRDILARQHELARRRDAPLTAQPAHPEQD